MVKTQGDTHFVQSEGPSLYRKAGSYMETDCPVSQIAWAAYACVSLFMRFCVCPAYHTLGCGSPADT